jgi:SCO1/SenC
MLNELMQLLRRTFSSDSDIDQRKKPTSTVLQPLPPRTQGRGGNAFPNVEVISHTGERLRFFDDLINDKVVLINFMSIQGHDRFPVTDRVQKIADRLGERLGRDTFIYSITTDPQHDSPERLQAFAEAHGVRPGWRFITGTRMRVAAASRRILKHLSHGGKAYAFPHRMIHYGNGGVGVWGAFAAESSPDMAIERLSWVRTGTQTIAAPRRAGPPKLAKSEGTNGNA